jgi:N-methylhydantoinase B
MGLVSTNPITVEVVGAGLACIANEMATVLRKTSYNMMIYEVRDYCVGIVDPEGNILSQNFGALPIFLPISVRPLLTASGCTVRTASIPAT